MYVRFIIFSLLCTGMYHPLHAQQQIENSKIKFTSINQVGLLSGSAGQSASVQTINGFTKARWFTGIGTGIDYYGTRSVPVFVDVRSTLSNKLKRPFLYADGGINFPWISDGQKIARGYTATSSPGVYLEGGAGLKFKMKNNNAFLLSAGFSYKEVKDKTEMMRIWIWPTSDKTYETYKYQYRRIVVKLALEL